MTTVVHKPTGIGDRDAKQNITLRLSRETIQKARVLAAKRAIRKSLQSERIFPLVTRVAVFKPVICEL